MCHPSKDFKPVWGQPRECSQTPHWYQLKQPTVGPQHSFPDPDPKATTCSKERTTRGYPCSFSQPWPHHSFSGIVDGQEITTLINSGTQVSSIGSQFCGDLVLQIHPLGQLLELEGTGGSAIPYLGFLEVNLQIPGIKNYNEDVLLLVITTMTYSWDSPSHGWIQNNR